MALDEQRQSAVHTPPESRESPSPPPGLGQMARLLQKLRRTAPKKERAEFERLLAETKPLLAYLERQEEIEAASTELEAHRTEFDRLVKDEAAYLDRAQAIFAEERFAPLWFTAADIRRAFESVGYPLNSSPDDEVVENLRAAILCLADKQRRTELAMNLLLHLPHYVAAGRHLDGWLIQYCADATVEIAEESNPFLFQMFSHGYDAWVGEENARDEALLREVGVDPARLHSMSLEEIDAWLEAQQADPAKKARMEAVLQANPDRRAQAIAGLERMERDFIKLLEREDTRALLLPQEEVEPWLPALSRRLESAQGRLPELSDDTLPDAAATKAFADVIWPVVGEMTQSIFTPERVQQLVSQLRQYRSEQFAAGDKGAAGCAIGAIASLEQEDDPGRNYLLNALCFVSLRALLASYDGGS